MLPESLIRDLDASCLRLYAWLDLRQGDGGRPCRNITALAKVLHLSRSTVELHLAHLERLGLVVVERDGTHAAVIRRCPNPSRKPRPISVQGDGEVAQKPREVRAETARGDGETYAQNPRARLGLRRSDGYSRAGHEVVEDDVGLSGDEKRAALIAAYRQLARIQRLPSDDPEWHREWHRVGALRKQISALGGRNDSPASRLLAQMEGRSA